MPLQAENDELNKQLSHSKPESSEFTYDALGDTASKLDYINFHNVTSPVVVFTKLNLVLTFFITYYFSCSLQATIV